MRHPGWKLAFGFVAASICLAAPSTTKAAPYYTATYVGTNRDIGGVGDTWSGGGVVEDHATGVGFPFVQTNEDRVGSQPAGFFDGLPTMQTYRFEGGDGPTWMTLAMKPEAMNAAGVVLGTLPVFVGDPYPWASAGLGYTERYPDGSFGRFIDLEPHDAYHGVPQISDAGRILIQTFSKPMLYDVKTGVRSSVRDLVPPELLAKYPLTSLSALGLDDRGDILVRFSNLVIGSTDDEDVYILTPPGLDAPAPVPEPSVLWFAAAAVAGLGFRARRRRHG